MKLIYFFSFVFFFVFFITSYLFNHVNPWVGIAIYIGSGALFYSNGYDTVMDKYYNPVMEFFVSMVSILFIPFLLLGDLFSCIFKIYENNCPPIVWEKN